MGFKRFAPVAFKKDWLEMILNNAVEYGLQMVLAKYKCDLLIMAIILVAL
jgi:hypothetical protein